MDKLPVDGDASDPLADDAPTVAEGCAELTDERGIAERPWLAQSRSAYLSILRELARLVTDPEPDFLERGLPLPPPRYSPTRARKERT
jgi:hypothetical protein